MSKDTNEVETTRGVCPRCGGVMPKEPGRCALSRTDDVTWVCPPCGDEEALEWFAASQRAGCSVQLSKAAWKN